MESATTNRPSVKPPNGVMSAKVDANGRVKLPARFVEYWSQLEDKRIFATLLNGMARMYLNGSWERNLDLLKPWPAKRKAMALVAGMYGQDLEVDEMRRVTLPPLMRKELGLENQQIHIQFHDDVAMMYTDAQFAEQTAAARMVVDEWFGEAEALGFV